jgi:hypothetical protein
MGTDITQIDTDVRIVRVLHCDRSAMQDILQPLSRRVISATREGQGNPR